MTQQTKVQPKQISRSTIYRYEKAGHDMRTNGKIDQGKVKAIFTAKRNEERKQKPADEGRYWDTVFPKERALKLIREREIAEGVLVVREEVDAEVIRRETVIMKAVLALAKILPPLLEGKRSATMAQIIHEHHAKVFKRLAKTL